MNWTRGLRALIVIAAVSLAAALGYWAGRLLMSRWLGLSTLRAPAYAIAAVAFLLSMATFLLALPSIVRFIRCGFSQTRQCAADLWPALLCFALGFFGLSLFGDRVSASEDRTQIGIVFGQRSTHDAVFIPFFPKEGQSQNCDPNQTTFGKGQELKPGAESALEDLMKSLGACSVQSSRPVRIDVRGFASTSEFQNCKGTLDGKPDSPSLSEHLNWRLAEARRQKVIQTVTKSNGIIIDPPADRDRWKSPEEMRSNMHFYDKDFDGKNSYNGLKGGLTRRAELIILSKGTCEPID